MSLPSPSECRLVGATDPSVDAEARHRSPWHWLPVVGGLAVLCMLANLPVRFDGFSVERFARPAVEVAALAALIAMLPHRWSRAHRLCGHLFGLAVAVVLAVKLAELAAREALGRPFNLLLDPLLAGSVVDLLSGAIGWGRTAAVAVLLVAGLVAAYALARWTAHGVRRVAYDGAARASLLAACAIVVGLYGVQRAVPDAVGGIRPVGDHAYRIAREQALRVQATLAELPDFRSALAGDPLAGISDAALLSRLGAADILVMFVESYGRSAIEDPRYAAVVGSALTELDTAVGSAGLTAASGWLRSPVAGGQSWLAHGSLLGGLWLDNQRRYDLMVASGRPTLVGDAAAAGYRTVAVMPAITLPWPEVDYFGYEATYFRDDLGYRGLPYNWVTMPDQYTLAALERIERADRPAIAPPLFAKVALISSHAPWTPIPPVLADWQAIGDGSVFSRWAEAGDPPAVVWRDHDRVRTQYGLAVAYTIETLASYVGRFVDDRTLVIVVGDHQPAPLITGDGAGRDVPVHVVSGDPALVEPFVEWGFDRGVWPPDDRTGRTMAAFRPWFLDAFSEGTQQAEASR